MGSSNMNEPNDDRTFIAVLTIGFVVSFSSGLLTPVLPIYLETLGILTSQIGILYSLTSISGAVSRIPLGIVSDKIGRKKVIIACLSLNAVSGILYIVMRQLNQLIILQILQGIVVGGFGPLMMAVASLCGPQKRSTRIMSYTTATTLSFTLGMPLGSMLSAIFGFESMFMTYAFFLLPAVLASLILMSNPDQGSRERSRKVIAKEKKPKDRKSILTLIYSISPLLVFSFLYSFQYNAYSPYIPLMISNLGVDLASIGTIFLIGWITYVVVQMPAGKLSDRIGRTRIIILGMMIGAISTLSMSFSIDIVQFSIFWGLCGVGTGMALVFYVLAADISREQERSTVIALISAIYAAGASLGPLLGGWAGQIYGIRTAILVATSAQLLSIVMILILHVFKDKTAWSKTANLEEQENQTSKEKANKLVAESI